MIIRVKDIPFQGRDIEFELNTESLNARINSVRLSYQPGSMLPPEYLFIKSPECKLNLQAAGVTVFVKGQCKGVFRSPCSRCAEDLETEIEADISMVLKPFPTDSRPGVSDEDVDFGYHDGREINCAPLAEEQLILRLPYVVSCQWPDISSCPKAQAVRRYLEGERQADAVDERLAVLKNIKIVQ